MSLPETQPDVLWRDPAILRLQPSRIRLWFAYCTLPLLSATLVLAMPAIDQHFVRPWFINTFGLNIKGVPPVTRVQQFEIAYGLARVMGQVFGGLSGLLPGLHMFLVLNWGLGPILKRLKAPNLRRELKVAHVTADNLLGAFLAPHIAPTLAGCGVLCILQWALMSLLPARYGYFSLGEMMFYALWTILFLSTAVSLSLGEDFGSLFDPAALPRHLWDGACGLVLMGLPITLLFSSFASIFPPSDPNPLLLLRLSGFALAFIAGNVLLAHHLWRRMCRFFAHVE